MKISVAVLCTVQLLFSQNQPDWSHTFGDSTTAMEMHDFFVDADGTLFVVGQKLPEGKRIFTVSAVAPNGVPVFETDIEGAFEEEGLLISPYDDAHIVAAGFFEDQTGTFNFRTLKLTKSGGIVWNKEFGKDSMTIMDVPTDMEIDPFGNIVVGGNSHSFNGKYGLVQYSSDGNENWSMRHLTFADGFTSLKDIEIDAAGNIYGITSNSFVNDTTHGTIFKRDKNGVLLWEKSFDLTVTEVPGEQLLLLNDTVYVAGSLFTEGAVNSVVVCVALTSDGDVASYRRFELPGKPVQLGVRSLASVPGNRLALVNDSFLNGKRAVHTFVTAKDFSILYTDSMSEVSEITAAIIPSGNDGFGTYVLGSDLRMHRYRMNAETIFRIDTQHFPVANKAESKIIPFGDRVYVGAIDFDMTPVTSTVKRFTPPIVNTVPQHGVQPSEWTLYPAYPNPFNPSTTVTYKIPVSGKVSLALYDMAGRMVKILFNGVRTEGIHTATIHADDLSSGVYFVTMDYAGRKSVQRVVLVK